MLTLDQTDARDLMARAQAGDPDAFTTLYTRYRRLVISIARQYHPGQADDVAQDVWCKVLRSHTWRDQGTDPGRWLRTVTVNMCRDLARSAYEQRVIVRDRDDLDQPGDPQRTDPAEMTVDYLARRDALAGALGRIRPDRREALVLYYLRDMSMAEIAQAMAVTEARVRVLLFHGRRTLAVELASVVADA